MARYGNAGNTMMWQHYLTDVFSKFVTNRQRVVIPKLHPGADGTGGSDGTWIPQDRSDC